MTLLELRNVCGGYGPVTVLHDLDLSVAENISLEELRSAPPLDDKRIDALVAFLKTLTDRRYEPLLQK